MGPDYRFTPITGLDARLRPLEDEAARDGLRFVARLASDWASGSNTFSRPGEHLVGVVRGDGLIGFCGLNRDPYATQSDVGRLRHLYVSKRERQKGVGAALVRHLLEKARGTFRIVRLRTDTPQAALFYQRLGFARNQEQDASHTFTL
jgi:GNAT superfamily N-acetyltransferase